MSNIINTTKEIFRKKAAQKKNSNLGNFSSITEELTHYITPSNVKYEKEIYKQVKDLLSKKLGIKTYTTSKKVVFNQEGTKFFLFLPDKKIVIHFIFNELKTPTEIQDEWNHQLLVLTKQPKIQNIENQLIDLINE